MEWLKTTRVMRANQRVGTSRANLLAGGVAYNALFSIFSVLALGVTFVMVTLGGNPELRDTVLASLSDALPGIIAVEGEGSGLVTPEDLVMDTALNPVTIVSAVVLLMSAKGMMTALRTSLRAVAGISQVNEPFLPQMLRDLVGFLVLGLAVILTSVVVVATQAFGEQIFEWIGLSAGIGSILLRIAAYVVTLLIDFGIVIFVYRVLGGIRAPRKDLLLGGALGGVALGVLRALGTAVVSVPDNAIMASATAIVTLLLLVNLMVRVLLIICAIMVNPPAPVVPDAPEEVHFNSTPNYVTLSMPETLEWDFEPSGGNVVPDPTLNPDYEPEPEAQPKWGGLIGRMQERRIEKLESKLERARENRYR